MLWLAHRQLKSKSVRVRCQAVQQLRQAESESSWLLLIRCLQADPDPLVRGEAASALGHWKDARSVNALLGALKDAAPRVQSASLESLRRLADPAIVPQLAAMLPNAAPALRLPLAQALQALGWQAPDPALQALFLVALGDLDRAAILGSVAVDPLGSVLKDGAYQKRVNAVHRLAEIGDSSVVPLLTEALRDSDNLVRAAAANALAHFADPHSVPHVAALLKDSDPTVRAAAVSTLGILADPRAVDPVLEATRDGHWEVRASAFEALGRMHDPRGLEPMLAGLGDPDREVRERAAEGLGVLGDQHALGALLRAAIEPETRVRQAAARALARLNPSWHQTAEAHLLYDTLQAATRHSDHGVQMAAVEILRRMGESPIMGRDVDWGSTTAIHKRHIATRRLFQELLVDPQPDLRQAAVECLQRLKDPNLAANLAPLSADPDPAVRRAVRAALAGTVSSTNPPPGVALRAS